MRFNKIILSSLLLLATGQLAFGQDNYQMKANTDEIEANFLSSYYNQDGNNAAVTGGVGTEALTDAANIFVLNVPLDSTKSLSITAGADFYTSASTDNINSNVSSASAKDLRIYSNVGFNIKNLKKGETYGIKAGVSTEYDYQSVSGGLSYTKEFNEGNSEVSFTGQAFFDNWDLIFPSELRREVSLPNSDRQSYNGQLVFSQVINKRVQMSISAEAILMKGLLSTPFHRVYFAEKTIADIERLPNSRLKIPVGLRLNYFATDNIILRSYYRFYSDDWGIQAHTASLDVPIKVNPTLTVMPFYRYHTQTAADYFAPFKAHSVNETLYTSDYDLSELSSHKIGLGVRIAPVYGLARAKFFKRGFQIKYLELRGAYYTRDTGLTGYSGSLNLGFSLNKKR
ncbi:MAG: DUF3570 domain-containing protein [Saprospiraceae bacterium]